MQAPPGPQITPEVLEQHPLLAVYLLFVMGVVILAGLGSFATWGLVFYRRSLSQPILPLVQPWEPRRWAFTDLIVLAVTFVAMQLIFASMASKWVEREDSGKLSLEIAAAGGLGGIIAVLFGTAWICLRYRTNAGHLGFDALKPRTLGVGVLGGLLGLPLMYLLMGLATSISKTKYDHPLIDSASESGQLLTYLFAFFAAAIAAPITEEFFFRVVLQGWLQSMPFKSLSANFLGSNYSNQLSQPTADAEETGIPVTPELADADAGSIESIYASPTMNIGSPSANPSADASLIAPSLTPPAWPSVITGLLFGLAHFEYGVSFVPLTFLGIFLGLIYRQTHSIWPCIIIHMMLNGFSMLMLGLIILMKQAGLAVN